MGVHKRFTRVEHLTFYGVGKISRGVGVIFPIFPQIAWNMVPT